MNPSLILSIATIFGFICFISWGRSAAGQAKLSLIFGKPAVPKARTPVAKSASKSTATRPAAGPSTRVKSITTEPQKPRRAKRNQRPAA
ncbi:MAG: hypothetical protein ABJA67_05675 [Chthonomonadales bacterium]